MANPSENPNFGISGGPSHSGMEVDNDSIKELQRQQLEITKTIEKLMNQLTSQSAQKISSSQRSSVKEPEVFKGKTEDARRFLRYFTNWAIHQRNLRTEDDKRSDWKWISSAFSYFHGDAYAWASRFLQEIVNAELAVSSGDQERIKQNPFPFGGNWETFVKAFEQRFQPADDTKTAIMEMDALKQGTGKQSALHLVTKFQEIYPRTGLSIQDAMVRLKDKLSTNDLMWLNINTLANTLEELCSRIISNEFTMRTQPAQVTALRQGSSNPTATPATSDPNAMEIDASQQGPIGRSCDNFTQAMRGRCYGCRLQNHTKKDCKHNKTQCNHCKRYGHLVAVCQDRFMGLEKDRGLSRNTQRVRATATTNEAAFDICTGQPIYNNHATIAASTTPASTSVSAATPATPAAPNDFTDLQTIQ